MRKITRTRMYWEDERARLAGVLAGIALVVMSGCYSLLELRYLFWGRTSQATLTRTYEATYRGRAGANRRRVFEYEFTDSSGGMRQEKDSVHPDWPAPQAMQIQVQYLPGVDGSSRLVGHSQQFWLLVFGGCILAIGFWIYRIAREAA